MRGLRFSWWAALIAGVFLPAAETWRRWPVGNQWPFWLDDVIGAALLLSSWHAGQQ